MFKVQDFNPIFNSPSGLVPTSANNNLLTVNGGATLGNNNSNQFIPQGAVNSVSTPSWNHFTNHNQQPNDERSFTYTNYYKFCSLTNVNCYFYQFSTSGVNAEATPNPVANSNNNAYSGNQQLNNANNTGNNNSATNSTTGNTNSNSSNSTYEILKYERLIKQKLENDYQIKDIITWIAKKELCLFQLQCNNDSSEDFDSNVGFNQLKDAMSNIISENNLSLKLITTSTLNAQKISDSFSSNQTSTQNQMNKKSLNVTYLSFLRAVHKFVLQKFTNSHSLFEASNQSLSIEILPYSGQLIASSMIQKSVIMSDSKKVKVLKKLVPYSILKLGPSLNQKNELIINLTSLKKIFYKLTDYITVSCHGILENLDHKPKFALYIAPSGLRCLVAGENYASSITDEPPENYEKLFNILKTFNDIDLVQNSTLINGKRLWIKIHPSIISSSSISPHVANYIDSKVSTGKKFIYWPLELCFIQFSTDSSPISLDEEIDDVSQIGAFTIDNPFDLVNDFIDIDVDTEKSKGAQDYSPVNKQENIPVDIINKSDNKSEFKFPVSFDFKPEIDSIDQQLKPNKDNEKILDDIMKSGDDFNDLFNSKTESTDLLMINNGKQNNEDQSDEKLNSVFRSNDEPLKDDEIKLDTNFDDDWDDLFGDDDDRSASSDTTEAKSNQSHASLASSKNDKISITANEDFDIDNDVDKAIDDAFSDVWEMEKYDQNLSKKNETEEGEGIHKDSLKLEHPKEELILKSESVSPLLPVEDSQSHKSLAITTPLYQDPGAPSPIPFQIFAPTESSYDETSTVSNEDCLTSKPTSFTPKERKKSIFSPLNFNPLIEKDIDSKYSNGGKFFVKNNKLSTPTDLHNYKDQVEDAQRSSVTPMRNMTPATNPDSKFSGLTTPLFLVHGSTKANCIDSNLSAGDLISDSDDEYDDAKNIDLYPLKNPFYDMNDVSSHSKISESGKLLNAEEDFDDEDEDEIEQDNNDSNDASYEEPDASASKVSGLGIIAVVDSHNPLKKRKFETMFDDFANGYDDDDELDLDFEEEDIQNNGDVEMIGLSDIGATDLNKDKTSMLAETLNIEVPNSWFFVLRPVSPIQIPFNFLNRSDLKIDKGKINSFLPILQEYILFSQKYMNNQMLNILIENRECPSVLDMDVEYLLFKLFPGVGKVQCHELLNSDKETKILKPAECLFGEGSSRNNTALQNKNLNHIQDTEIKLFEENNYGSASPSMTAPPTDSQLQHVIDQDEVLGDIQDWNLAESLSEEHVFRIKSTILDIKRGTNDAIINSIGLNFWKMLNLEPLLGKKNFEILFVIPKLEDAGFCAKIFAFVDTLIQFYSECKLGEITKMTETGVIEIKCPSTTNKNYWDEVQSNLLSSIPDLQRKYTLEEDKTILLILVDPFQNLSSLIRMAEVTQVFESALLEKNVPELETNKKKKKRKNKSITKLPLLLFYKALSIDSFYLRESGQYVIFTNEKFVDLALELYNNCPESGKQSLLKDRSNIHNITRDIQEKIKFSLTRKQISDSLIENETYLHVCYERSVDKRWCVASWVDQSGRYNYTKSWCIGEDIEGSHLFENVADDIMNITMDYVANIPKKCYVVLTRLNNIIPDDELAEWKRLSSKNTGVVLIVMTAELESSTLILSNNPGPLVMNRNKTEISKDLNFTVASTNSQSQTPANGLISSNNYTHLLGNSTKLESPDVSMYTPSYEFGLSPLDVNSHQAPLQTLQSLPEEIVHDQNSQSSKFQKQTLMDISDECYGLIFQFSQPLSNQPRVPLKTGFLVNTGEGVTKNMVLEMNLLSCQSGMNTNEFMKKLLFQYKNLGSLAPRLGMTSIIRKCGNVDFDDLGEEDDDETVSAWEDEHIRKEKHFIQQQYIQFHKMQQRQKRQRIKESESDFNDNDTKYNVIPVHILAVRKMLDFLVNVKVE